MPTSAAASFDCEASRAFCGALTFVPQPASASTVTTSDRLAARASREWRDTMPPYQEVRWAIAEVCGDGLCNRGATGCGTPLLLARGKSLARRSGHAGPEGGYE